MYLHYYIYTHTDIFDLYYKCTLTLLHNIHLNTGLNNKITIRYI